MRMFSLLLYFAMKRVFNSAFILVLSLLAVPAAMAQEPSVNVRAVLVSALNDTVFLVPGGEADVRNAPLQVLFESAIVSGDGRDYVMFPQWVVTRQTGTDAPTQYLKRQDANSSFVFEDFGEFQINFSWSYRDRDSVATVPGTDVEPMKFSIDDSDIKTYNAFSPNGDGINDVYCIYMQSIVRADIAIFNRWGQTIRSYSGSMDELISMTGGQEDGDGYVLELWDGMFNGETVKDGVYFINVKATGAGGRKYEKKESINVLKGLGEMR